RAHRITLVVLIAATIAAASGNAQETPSTFEFSFSNPGARSLGLGGAFSALADDATAAFANPAGLVQLVSLEVSAEVRHWSYSTPYIEGGRFEGEPTGIGLDTVDGLRTAVSEEQLTGLSFLSFVYPKGRWSIAVYRHQLANFRAQTDTQGLFHTGGTGTETFRTFDRRWSTDLDIVSYGVAGAYRISDRFSLGLGLVYFDGRLEAPFAWYFPDDDSLQGIFGPNSYLPERQLVNGDMAFDDSDWGLSAGLLWSFAEGWALGAFYRQGPEFRLVFDTRAGPVAQDFDPALTPGATILTIATPMQFPDVYGLGIAYRSPDGKLAVGFEWDRVGYSSIFDSFDPVVIETLDDDLDLGVDLVADDGNELRLGAEYAFLDLKPVLAIRAGVWLDPDHRFRSTSDDPEHRALFQPGEDEVHVAVGLGLAFASFQIDLAADFSDLVDTVSLSMIYSF
ncbi:MAG: outer membrane protein transport protein, partial [Acidobacteria bacterium]|nr:outer membrane protein transport protein [Candidatus Sulfomarinibacter sp. MAG AM2]